MRQIKLTYNEAVIDFEEALKWFIKIAYVVFLYYSMYSRAEGLLWLSGGMTAALMSAGIFFLSIVYSFYLKENFVVSQLVFTILIFFTLVAITPIISALIFDISTGVILRFIMEIGVVVFIFLATYNFIRAKIISPKFFLYALAFLGFIAALTLLQSLIGATHVWRVRTSIGGVNYIGTTIGMSTIAWIMILYSNTFEERGDKKFNKLKMVAFILTLFAMILTGTRSAAIGFFVGLSALLFFGFRRKNLKKYLLTSVGCVGFVVLIFVMNFDISRLLDRYTIDQLVRMANIRFTIYALAVTDLTLLEFLFGRPDLYIFSSGMDGSRLVNTHNILLSFIRYHGIFVFTFFVMLLFAVFFNYLKLYKKNKNLPLFRFTESSIVVLLAMAIVYTMFSGGRPTRAFSLFVALGYFAGYFELLKNVESVEEYKKMIL